MSALEKAMVLALVSTSTASKSQTLAEIGIPRRTYYNRVRQEKAGGKKSVKRRPSRSYHSCSLINLKNSCAIW